MNQVTKELWLFTMRFPYGTSEPFLENELPLLCERFSKVRIFPMFTESGIRELPENAEVEVLFPSPYSAAGPLLILRSFKAWQRAISMVKGSAPSASIRKKQWPDIRSRMRQAISRAAILKDRMAKGYDPDQVVLYSYWTYDWATVLGILRTMDPHIHFVTRMLGFDMFKFRSPDGWPAFRIFHLEMVDQVHIISKAGMEHMVENYPSYQLKYRLSLLATNDHGVGPWSTADELRLVSCSNLVALKRVALIVEALKGVERPVRWTHFGSGPEQERIKSMVEELPSNIQVDLKGNRPNKEIIAWYKEHPVDLFLHVSSTEGGVPVALQEAASFGIPLYGADSGGVGEIVNDITGELLPHQLTPSLLAQRINDFQSTHWYSEIKREQVRAFWADNFRADVIYKQFAEELSNN